MDVRIERKLMVNAWLVRSRWFYILGILLIGLMPSMINQSVIYFPKLMMFILLIVIVLINFIFFFFIRSIKRTEETDLLNFIGILQIAFELIIFTLFAHAISGIESVVLVFYFLPIMSTAVLFTYLGPLFTAVASILLVNGLHQLKHFGSLGVSSEDMITDVNLVSITDMEVITFSFFYIIVAIFAAMLAQLLFKREEMVNIKNSELQKESQYRENEWRQLDKTTKLLVKRDKQMTELNSSLDKKVHELEKSELSLLKTFRDLKIERNKTEEERNKTASIISNFIDPILLISNDGLLDFYNPAAKDILGLTEADLGTKIKPNEGFSLENFKDIVKQNMKVAHQKDRSTGNILEEEAEIEFLGQKHYYKVITAAVNDKENRELGIMKIFYNLTREKNLDKMKSEFISIAAHQLRTPLSAIKWVIKMILDEDAGNINSEQKDLLTKGYQSNERIIQLVNEMLDVSRIEEGRFGYEFAYEDFLALLNVIVSSLEGNIKEKNIQINIKKPDKLPKIYMDVKRMSNVLQNLIENAIKYTPDHGKVDIDVRVSGLFIRVSIKDNGVGVPKDDQVKLFTKFFRAENVTRMQTEGSGLGLFIVKNIIMKHSGEITFKSTEGLGSEFMFTIPTDKTRDIEEFEKDLAQTDTKR